MQALHRLLRPRSIAVVGGGIWCANVIAQCQRIGFDGDIWPVHPTRTEVGGVRAWASVADLPDAPDASFIGVNREATIDVVAALAQRGAGGAVCFASGFSEVQQETGDGHGKQHALLSVCGNLKILGPNCYGFLNYLDGVALWPDQHGGERVTSGVGLITQSSNIAINLTMQKRGLPVAYVVTAGNQAQTDLSEAGIAVLQDPRVTALGLHIEGITDLRAFEALAQEAHRLNKPIVALKIGRSDQARAATISHTASLAGSEAGSSAFLKRLGIGQVGSLADLLETLKLLHVAGPLQSGRVASMSCSGGEAGLVADAAVGTSVEFPPLNLTQKDNLRAALGPTVALANPLDYHTYVWGNEKALFETFSAMMDPEHALGIVVLDFPRADRCDPAAWEPVVSAVIKTKAATGCPMAILGSLSDTMPEDVARKLVGQGIIPFAGLPEAISAIEVAAQLGRPYRPVEPILLPALHRSGKTMSEADAKAALAAYGVQVPTARRADSAAGAGDATTGLRFPVVLKGEGVSHKTEAGAVALGLASKQEVVGAASAMGMDRFLVEEMVTGTVAELLVGVVCDPAHGYVLTLAAGGTLTELMSDSTSMLLPVKRTEILTALEMLKVNKLLDGYRGAPCADKDAIVDAVMAVQSYVIAHRPMEIEINPLMCGPSQAVAADALIITGECDD